ncbi:MAG: cell division protein FtsQ/DivIB [Acidimicrobiales bacterium]
MSRHAATRERPGRSEVVPAQATATPTPRRRMRRLTKWLVSLGVVTTLAVLGAQWMLHKSYLRVQHVTIVGIHHESVAAIMGRSGLALHPSMIDLNAGKLEKRLETFPWVDTAAITKKWPNTVIVTVHENVAVAVAFTARHVLEFVDATGRALGVAPLHENLPTLEYLKATSTSWPYAKSGRGAAYVASRLPRAFATQVDAITDDAQGSVTLQMSTPVTFVLGPPSDLHAKFVAIASVISHSTLVPGDVVDVTVPDELAVTSPSNS